VDEDLRTELELMVRGGFQSRDEILEAIREIAGDDGADLGDEESASAVDAAIAAWRDDARLQPRPAAARRIAGRGSRARGRRPRLADERRGARRAHPRAASLLAARMTGARRPGGPVHGSEA
jgi:hypothetical protein